MYMKSAAILCKYINMQYILDTAYYTVYNIYIKYNNGGVGMTFPVSAALLDAMVLAVVEKEETYGYKITQELCESVSVSESTLYPVLRRLQKGGCLDTYDKAFQGRNRRYYRLTQQGASTLSEYRSDWIQYCVNIDRILNCKGDKAIG